MEKSWKKGFDAAKAASQNSIAPRVARKVGAALFSGSVLLAIGHNSYGHSHPQAEIGHNLHAEHRALLRRRYYDVRGEVMYVWREKADGSPGCCRPCDNCMGLMKEAGIRVVRFVDEAGTFNQVEI